jgi:hypothetical protein
MDKNRIAILITGLPRLTFDVKSNIFDFFISKELKDKVDLFFCTWFDDNCNFKKLQEEMDFKVLDVSTQSLYTNSYLIKDFNNFNNFCKTYKNEDPYYILYSLPYYINSSPLNSMYQIYQINRGFNIIKNYSLVNNIKYDIIIRTRIDVEFLHTFTPDLYDKTIKSKNTFFGRNWTCEKTDAIGFYNYANNWVDDLYFHANFESFEKISSIYDEYYDLSIKHNTWISHVLLYQFLKRNNMTFEKSPIKTLVRRDGGGWDMTLFNF